MSVQSLLVEGIFAKMAVRYGALWLAKWDGIPIDAVKADWALELEGVSPASVRYALDYLPLEFPPNAAQFKALCHSRPEPAHLALPDNTKASPQSVAVARAVVDAMKAAAKRGRLQWAYDLQEREKRGDALSAAQMASWRMAIAEQPSGEVFGSFTPIPEDVLPPGMRSTPQPEVRDDFRMRVEDYS